MSARSLDTKTAHQAEVTATAISGAQLIEREDGEMVAVAIPSYGNPTWEFTFSCFANGESRLFVLNLAEENQPVPESAAAVEVSIFGTFAELFMQISNSTWYWADNRQMVSQYLGGTDDTLIGTSYEAERVLMHMLHADRMSVRIGDLSDLEFDMAAARPILAELNSRCEAFN